MFFLSLLAACGGLSSSTEAIEADVDTGSNPDLDVADLDEDGVADGYDDPIVVIQAMILEGFDMPMICGHKTIRLYTRVSVFGGWGQGGSGNNWTASEVEATRLIINGAEYDCFLVPDNGAEYQGAGRNPSESCDEESDPDYQSFQCWWNLTDMARADEYVFWTEDEDYNLSFMVVDNVMYPGNGNATDGDDSGE